VVVGIRAGRAVVEQHSILIVNHFESKAGLFQAAVLEPFAAFVDEFVAAWIVEPHTTDVARETRIYVATLIRAKLDMIISMSVCDFLFYDRPGDKPDDEHVIEQLCRLIIDGYHDLD
jgi:hypothetical protein